MDFEAEDVRPRENLDWGHRKRRSDPTIMQVRCYRL